MCECVKENVCEDVDEEYERGGVVTHSIVEYRESEELKRRKKQRDKKWKTERQPSINSMGSSIFTVGFCAHAPLCVVLWEARKCGTSIPPLENSRCFQKSKSRNFG